jgi:hypothetical protein
VRVSADAGDEECAHGRLSQPAIARILGERRTHRRGLDLSLKIGDHPCVSLRFPVHGILKTLDQPLQVRDACLERRERADVRIAGAGVLSIPGLSIPGLSISGLSISGLWHAAHLADPRDQAFAIAHRHRLAGPFG